MSTSYSFNSSKMVVKPLKGSTQAVDGTFDTITATNIKLEATGSADLFDGAVITNASIRDSTITNTPIGIDGSSSAYFTTLQTSDDVTFLGQNSGQYVTYDSASGQFDIAGTINVYGTANFGNIRIRDNDIYASNANGDVYLKPNGFGTLYLSGPVNSTPTLGNWLVNVQNGTLDLSSKLNATLSSSLGSVLISSNSSGSITLNGTQFLIGDTHTDRVVIGSSGSLGYSGTTSGNIVLSGNNSVTVSSGSVVINNNSTLVFGSSGSIVTTAGALLITSGTTSIKSGVLDISTVLFKVNGNLEYLGYTNAGTAGDVGIGFTSIGSSTPYFVYSPSTHNYSLYQNATVNAQGVVSGTLGMLNLGAIAVSSLVASSVNVSSGSITNVSLISGVNTLISSNSLNIAAGIVNSSATNFNIGSGSLNFVGTSLYSNTYGNLFISGNGVYPLSSVTFVNTIWNYLDGSSNGNTGVTGAKGITGIRSNLDAVELKSTFGVKVSGGSLALSPTTSLNFSSCASIQWTNGSSSSGSSGVLCVSSANTRVLSDTLYTPSALVLVSSGAFGLNSSGDTVFTSSSGNTVIKSSVSFEGTFVNVNGSVFFNSAGSITNSGGSGVVVSSGNSKIYAAQTVSLCGQKAIVSSGSLEVLSSNVYFNSGYIAGSVVDTGVIEPISTGGSNGNFWFGYRRTTGMFTFMTNVTNNSGVILGDVGDCAFKTVHCGTVSTSLVSLAGGSITGLDNVFGSSSSGGVNVYPGVNSAVVRTDSLVLSTIGSLTATSGKLWINVDSGTTGIAGVIGFGVSQLQLTSTNGTNGTNGNALIRLIGTDGTTVPNTYFGVSNGTFVYFNNSLGGAAFANASIGNVLVSGGVTTQNLTVAESGFIGTLGVSQIAPLGTSGVVSVNSQVFNVNSTVCNVSGAVVLNSSSSIFSTSSGGLSVSMGSLVLTGTAGSATITLATGGSGGIEFQQTAVLSGGGIVGQGDALYFNGDTSSSKITGNSDTVFLSTNSVVNGDLTVLGSFNAPTIDTDLNKYIIELGTSVYTGVYSVTNSTTGSGYNVVQTASPVTVFPGDLITVRDLDSTPNVSGDWYVHAVIDTTHIVLYTGSVIVVPASTGIVKSPLTSNANKDVGLQINYYNGVGTKYHTGFLGFAITSGNTLVWFSESVISHGNLVSGTLGTFQTGTLITNSISAASLVGGLSCGNQLVSGTNFDVNGGAIDATPIGATTPASGKFSSLTVNGSAGLGNVYNYGVFCYSTERYTLSSAIPVRSPSVNYVCSFVNVTSVSFECSGTLGNVGLSDGQFKMISAVNFAAGSVYRLRIPQLCVPISGISACDVSFTHSGQSVALIWDNIDGTWILMNSGAMISAAA